MLTTNVSIRNIENKVSHPIITSPLSSVLLGHTMRKHAKCEQEQRSLECVSA